jgi:hypothetical protein
MCYVFWFVETIIRHQLLKMSKRKCLYITGYSIIINVVSLCLILHIKKRYNSEPQPHHLLRRNSSVQREAATGRLLHQNLEWHICEL